MDQAELILLLVKLWGGVGAIVALAFLSFGIDRLDEDARGAYVFRLLIVPGVLLIWPLVLWRWYILADGKDEWAKRYQPKRDSHNLFALVMPVLIVGIIAAGLSVRQTWPVDVAPVQLSEPGQ
jgi:hypothetical protein